jgi:hypothetical protein
MRPFPLPSAFLLDALMLVLPFPAVGVIIVRIRPVIAVVIPSAIAVAAPRIVDGLFAAGGG